MKYVLNIKNTYLMGWRSLSFFNKKINVRGLKYLYQYFGKRLIDLVLSGIGIVIFAFQMLIIALLIKISDPGPALFQQRRVGLHKKHFMLFKFRSMKMVTPHDVPTHQLKNPEQYLLKIGVFLRKYSLDELPQLFNIFRGEMSFIGPRPALWNQYDLIEAREKYGANDIKPGLSGWAQINGRDELEILVKAKLDGEYVRRMNFYFDCQCFFGTIGKVLKHDGVVEGGTGQIRQRCRNAQNKGKGKKNKVNKSVEIKKKAKKKQ